MQGHSVIIVVIDRLSKYCHLGSLSAKYSSSMVVDYFTCKGIRLHGIPKTIVSDKDKIFLSRLWKEIFMRSETTLSISPSYHRETDGQMKIVNKMIEQYLHIAIHENPRSWIELLSWAELCYNMSHHHSLGTSPFQVVYGRPPPEIIDYRPEDSNMEAVDFLLKCWNEILRELHINLVESQERMKVNADKKHRAIRRGPWLWLKLQPYR